MNSKLIKVNIDCIHDVLYYKKLNNMTKKT